MDEQKTLNWNARFHVTLPVQDQLILIDETKSHLFQGEYYQHLFLHIDGTRSIIEVLDSVGGVGPQAVCLMTIDRLIEDGYLEERAVSQANTSYVQPDVDAEPERAFTTADGLELTILSQFDNPALWVEWGNTLKITQPTGLVIVDDYLDLRLAEINRTYKRQGRPWLLMKPTGHQPLLGPYFIRTQGETPCWHCLAARLSLNQPVRHWLQSVSEMAFLPLPIYYDREAVTRVLAMATAPAQELLDLRPACRVWSFDPDDGSPVAHTVNHRPQCTVCGDPYLFTQNSSAHLSLASLDPSPKSQSRDGGYRTCTPEQTVEALEPVTSALTGIVHDVHELPQERDAGVTTYRSSFFIPPRAPKRAWSKTIFTRFHSAKAFPRRSPEPVRFVNRSSGKPPSIKATNPNGWVK